MQIDDIKKLCNLRRVVRITNKTKALINDNDYVVSQKDDGHVKIAALIKDGFVVELLVDNYNITEEDIMSFYHDNGLTFKPHPDSSLRTYRRLK